LGGLFKIAPKNRYLDMLEGGKCWREWGGNILCGHTAMDGKYEWSWRDCPRRCPGSMNGMDGGGDGVAALYPEEELAIITGRGHRQHLGPKEVCCQPVHWEEY
jgi:hypothetical protein